MNDLTFLISMIIFLIFVCVTAYFFAAKEAKKQKTCDHHWIWKDLTNWSHGPRISFWKCTKCGLKESSENECK